MDIFIVASQFILSLSILIVLHEFGHFITARMFGMRVEKFYLFFNPWFSLFKVKKGETEYGLGWLPLGGYVKISGMIDESMDKEQMKQPPQPWEFRSKPAWQRLIVMIGGVTVNLILGVLIYTFVVYIYGEKYLATENVKNGVWVTDSLGYELGFQDGDKILTIDNTKLEKFDHFHSKVLLDGVSSIQIERNGEKIDLTLPSDIHDQLTDKEVKVIAPRIPFVVGGTRKDTPARKAGIKKRDKIIGINDSLMPFFDQIKGVIEENKGKEVTLKVLRNEKPMDVKVKVTEEGYIGAEVLGDYEELGFTMNKITYTFAESFPRGIERAGETLINYVKQIRLLFKLKKGYEKLGGFYTIAKIFPTTWEWEAFWTITAFLSLVLAFMNILPIPALDGGHVMFLLYEIITGKKPSDKFMEYSTYVGFAILLSLLLLANGNDAIRGFKELFD